VSRNLARAVAGCALDLPYLQMKGKAMIARDFEPSFSLALEAGAVEHGDRDLSATFLTSAREAR
jgi:hypothetical protein